jgi:adenylate cyclase
MSESRKLAAILVADVVGYSRLAGADEDRTLARLRALRSDLIDPTIAVHHGRVVKRTGDGALVEFRSVVDAVRCAVEVQNGMVERNAGLPAERRIEFRIGIHLGDVVEESDGDLMGDGVNIAARLEGIANPGGICLSEDAYRQVKGRLSVAVSDLGATQLKNIADPIRIYSVEVGLAPQVKSATHSQQVSSEKPSAQLALPDKPSIAVLPFQNMSGDAEQEYFADGIAEDIITALSKSRWLFVIARNSSFAYKGRAVDIKQIGRELGVRYVLEGSVRKSVSRVRITRQLIEAATGAHLWAERYDRDLSDIFAVQDEITSNVAMAIGPTVGQAERERVARKLPDNLNAWEAYHRGLWHFSKQTPDENDKSKQFFQQAIDLDPNFAPGYHGLAFAHIWDCQIYLIRAIADCAPLMLKLSRKATELDDADATAHVALGMALDLTGDREGGGSELERAVSLDPNHAWAIGILGLWYGFYGRPREGIETLQRAMRGSPHDPLTWAWLTWIGLMYYFLEDYEAALKTADNVTRLRPDHFQAYRTRAAALGQLGRTEEARDALRLAAQFKGFEAWVQTRHPGWRQKEYAHVLEGLRKAGLPE